MTSTANRRRKALILGPEHHGKQMPLALFSSLETRDGVVFELGRGRIEMGEIPSRVHALVLQAVQLQFRAYQSLHPTVIRYQAGGSDAKAMVDAFESERHPDWSVYTSKMPHVEQPWSIWNPTLVVEVVSPSSIKRDYQEKPPEYLAIGVFQYWILDPMKSQLLVKTNKGGLWQDKVYKAGAKVTCPLLPKFSFDLRRAFAAAKA